MYHILDNIYSFKDNWNRFIRLLIIKNNKDFGDYYSNFISDSCLDVFLH